MKSILTILIALFAFNVANAQKIKLKRGFIYADGDKYAKYEKEAGNMSIYSLDEEEEELVYLKFYDPTPSIRDNGDGYFIVRFLDSGDEVEIQKSRRGIIKLLVKNKVIKDNKVDKERLKRFVNKYGNDSFRNRY